MVFSAPVIVIPAYKPGSGLEPLVRQLALGEFDVIVVDDGGEDATAAIFDAIARIERVTVLRHAVNLGKGAALKTAFNHVLLHHRTAIGVVTADADGQHILEDIRKVAVELTKKPRALVLGARQFAGKVPARSAFGNKMTRVILRMFTGIKLTDTQTGLRAIPTSMLRNLMPIKATRYDFELDMLLTLHAARVPFHEVPIETVYIDDNKSSHFNPIIDSARIYFVLLRFLTAAIVSAVLDNVLFIILFLASKHLFLATAVSRVISAVFNYSLVKRHVFRSKKAAVLSAPYYALLAVTQGLISYFLVLNLSSSSDIGVIVTKLLVEGLLFLASFSIQKTFIFNTPSQPAQDPE